MYRNDGTDVFNSVWTSVEMENTWSVTWGDYDSDGDLDLAAGNIGSPNRVYRYDGNDVFNSAWASEIGYTVSVSWGDYDGDGDLDLAAGNAEGDRTAYTATMAGASSPPRGPLRRRQIPLVSVGATTTGTATSTSLRATRAIATASMQTGRIAAARPGARRLPNTASYGRVGNLPGSSRRLYDSHACFSMHEARRLRPPCAGGTIRRRGRRRREGGASIQADSRYRLANRRPYGPRRRPSGKPRGDVPYTGMEHQAPAPTQ